MNFYFTKFHVSEKAKYYFIVVLVLLSSILLSMNAVVAQDKGYAKSSKIYKKKVKPTKLIMAPRTQCNILKKKKNKISRRIVASRRKPMKSKKMAEGGSL